MAGGTKGIMVTDSSTMSFVIAGTLKARHQNECRAQKKRGIEDHIQAVDMVEGERTENVVSGIERCRVWAQHLVNVGDQIVVRKHDSLGQASGAAGVGKSCQSLLRRTDRA